MIVSLLLKQWTEHMSHCKACDEWNKTGDVSPCPHGLRMAYLVVNHFHTLERDTNSIIEFFLDLVERVEKKGGKNGAPENNV